MCITIVVHHISQNGDKSDKFGLKLTIGLRIFSCMCITIVVHDNLFSGLFYILCVIKQIYIVLLRMLASTTSMTMTKNVGQQPLPMDAPNQNLQHHTDGHQPGKAEGLDLFEKSPPCCTLD